MVSDSDLLQGNLISLAPGRDSSQPQAIFPFLCLLAFCIRHFGIVTYYFSKMIYWFQKCKEQLILRNKWLSQFAGAIRWDKLVLHLSSL